MKIQTEALRAERAASGLTQEALARRAGVSRSAIQHAEYGRRPLSAPTIHRLAGALKCSVADIAEAETDAEMRALSRQLTREAS